MDIGLEAEIPKTITAFLIEEMINEIQFESTLCHGW